VVLSSNPNAAKIIILPSYVPATVVITLYALFCLTPKINFHYYSCFTDEEAEKEFVVEV
jgi:hypothetical protein